MKPAVLVLQKQVPTYRIPFFRALATELARRDLELHVASSSAILGPDELGFPYQNASISMGGLSTIEAIRRERPAAFVLPHSARFAPLAGIARLTQGHGRRQLLWGMGIARRYTAESECDRRPMGETIRRLMLRTSDHYLSYTAISTANIAAAGYDTSKITTLNNAVDALATRRQAETAQRIPLQVLFVGSLVEDKQPLATVEIIDQLRLAAVGATLGIVGDGPLRSECEEAASRREWVHYHGPQRGEKLRDLALASDIAIIPGRVGLAVLELASAGLPMATFAASKHGAEIAYLKDGVNGLLLHSDIHAAAQQLQDLLTDRPALEHMRAEALTMASKYTVRNMAIHFADGVTSSL